MVKLTSLIVLAVATLAAADSVNVESRVEQNEQEGLSFISGTTAGLIPFAVSSVNPTLEARQQRKVVKKVVVKKVVRVAAKPKTKVVKKVVKVTRPKTKVVKKVIVKRPATKKVVKKVVVKKPSTPAKPPVKISTPKAPVKVVKPPVVNNFFSDCLNTHNRVRRQDGKRALVWDSALQQSAQRWANILASRTTNNGGLPMEHSQSGENLYAKRSNGAASCSDATNMWYAEKPYYPPGSPIRDDAQFHKYGHYTQVVWGTTTKLGCAVANKSHNGPNGAFTSSYVVCHYNPPGNVIGQPLP
ncbi:CAP domain-containing protein [Powellomyces hirtus]|nr:CAP domain-containing protein [Powellomyces hirtus]